MFKDIFTFLEFVMLPPLVIRVVFIKGSVHKKSSEINTLISLVRFLPWYLWYLPFQYFSFL